MDKAAEVTNKVLNVSKSNSKKGTLDHKTTAADATHNLDIRPSQVNKSCVTKDHTNSFDQQDRFLSNQCGEKAGNKLVEKYQNMCLYQVQAPL